MDNNFIENTSKEYFTRVPNSLVQIDIKKKYNLHRIFYLIYIYHLPEIADSIHLIYADNELEPV